MEYAPDNNELMDKPSAQIKEESFLVVFLYHTVNALSAGAKMFFLLRDSQHIKITVRPSICYLMRNLS
jgi:hypothetical protein